MSSSEILVFNNPQIFESQMIILQPLPISHIIAYILWKL